MKDTLSSSWWLIWQRIYLQCRRPGFNPWVRKIPWRREWQPTPVFLPGEYHGQRSLTGYSAQTHKESDTTEQWTLSFKDILIRTSSDRKKLRKCGKQSQKSSLKKRKVRMSVHESRLRGSSLLGIPLALVAIFVVQKKSRRQGRYLQRWIS